MASAEQKENLNGEGADSFAARSKLLAKVVDVIPGYGIRVRVVAVSSYHQRCLFVIHDGSLSVIKRSKNPAKKEKRREEKKVSTERRLLQRTG